MSGLPDIFSQFGQILDLSGLPTDQVASYRTRVGALSQQGAQRVIDDGGFGLQAEVTVTEDHEDDLVITEHPVEYGAAITDHAYKRPAEVRLRVGWSAIYAGDVRMVYEQILALQQTRNPFTLETGKRSYQNMLVASIRVQTNATLEYSFIADITFRQILLVSTQTISSAQNFQNLSLPETNQGTVEIGEIQILPTSMTDEQLLDWGGDAVEFII